MRRALFVLLFCGLLLVACGTAEPTSVSDAPTDTAEPIATPTPVSPTATPLPPTETATPTDTATPEATETALPTDTPLPTNTAFPLLSLSGSGGVIAFTSERDGDAEIYVMNADGSDQRRLTFDPAYDAWPTWSPDGSQIAFTSDRGGSPGIYLMDADGGNVRPVTDDDGADSFWPEWSPDGSQIAFPSRRHGNLELCLLDVDSGLLQQLTDTPGHEDFPAWSPDGSQILFSRIEGDEGTYLMDAQGGTERQLLDYPILEPAWSPDGAHIVFGSDHEGFRGLYLMDADGANVVRLSSTRAGENCPTWSPDGSRIAFASWRDGDGEIYLMDPDGSDLVKLTDNRSHDEFPAWRPEPSQETVHPGTMPAAPEHGIEQVRITILYDNYVYDERLTSEWGFAALVEADDHVLLFDTGGSAALLDNMRLLAIDPASIEAIVLSHQHLDHIGGLLPLLGEGIRPTVYLLTSFPADFIAGASALTDVVMVTTSIEILPGIYTTGGVSGDVREQALAIRMGAGSVIITGCAHPGVERMVARARSVLRPGSIESYAPVALVVGGFHLGRTSRAEVEQVIAELSAMNVQRVIATHCTGDAAIVQFSEAFGDGYLPGGVGRVITLP
jgi:TolB protein